ncbi:MFS general substrate transporter [Schizopora paradoxa]|uniref:MFS general substrate transporter n=1 Tax=Schizopora paradoxa TaxID=27342 RepID=A0A0H2S4U7_9AGAM|nr:MFS general substrate transporter [Schizopora paradoxa]
MHSDPLLPEKVVDENTDRNSGSMDGEVEAENQGQIGKLDVDEPKPLDDCPEGGTWGWLAVLGGFCLSISIFGFINSWSTFQAYYELLDIASPSRIAWIGSLQYSLIFMPGILAGRLFDAGHFRLCLWISTILFLAANFLIAECKTYWQIILCQGIALGLGSGIVYVPCVAVVSQYFNKKRPIAFSVTAIGVSVGGIIFPIMFRNLLPSVGFKWAVRSMAFVNVAMFIIAHFTMFPRLPPSAMRGWIELDDFRQLQFTFFVICTVIAFFGLYTMLTFLSVSSLLIGFTESLAFYVVSIANATSAVGRMAGGVLAVKYGPVNILIFFTTIAAVCTYIWPFVSTKAGFIVLTCFYGISSGAFVGLFPLGPLTLGDTSHVGRRTGEQMTFMALGALFGPPISGAILDDANSFKPVGVYAGTTIILSVVFLMASRYVVTHKLIGGRV